MTLILMGDWCSEEITDTKTQRNLGNGMDSMSHGGGSAYLTSARKNPIFPCPGEVFPLTEGLLVGDPSAFVCKARRFFAVALNAVVMIPLQLYGLWNGDVKYKIFGTRFLGRP